jgi:4-amino-4-deoxy-L-arabinose transferase-like glycosyltransferase
MKLFGKRITYSLSSLLILSAIVHGGLLVYDLGHPDSLLHVDHGARRLKFMQGLLASAESGSELVDFATSHWIIGDYGLQAAIYGLVGQYGLIIFQIGLTLLSIACLYKLALLVSDSTGTALFAATVYAFLPHTLVYPHLLGSEAIFVPLVVFSFYFMSVYLLEQPRLSHLLLSGLMIGLATLARPVTLLWPVASSLVALLTFRSQLPFRRWFGYLAVASLPLLLWMLLMLSETGEFSMGKGSASLGSNFYTTVEFVSETLPPADRARIQETYLTYGARDGGEKMGFVQYLRFVGEYPLGYAEHQGRAAMMFFAKSGVNKVTKSYLQLFPEALAEIDAIETRKSWRQRLEQDGPLDTFRFYYQRYSILVLVAAVAGALFALVMAVAVYGTVLLAFKYFRGEGSANRRCMEAFLCLFPWYILLASMSSQRLQSRHRAPAEFAICLLFSIGICHLYGAWQRARARKHSQMA